MGTDRALFAEGICGQNLPEQIESFVLQAAWSWHSDIRTGAGKTRKECHG